MRGAIEVIVPRDIYCVVVLVPSSAQIEKQEEYVDCRL